MLDMSKGYAQVMGGVAILILLIGGFVAIQLLKTPGPELSCSNEEITGFGIPRRPLSVAAGPHCEVEITVEYNGELICENKGKIIGKDQGVVSCDGLSEYSGKEVDVEAVFYKDGERSGEDQKTLSYTP